MRASVVLTFCICIVAAGCGGKRASPTTTTTTTTAARSPAALRAARIEAVVRAWSRHLNAGDNAGAARLFAVPAIVIQPPYAFHLVSREQVAEWHATLPCSGHIVSITVRGETATVVFRLGNRPTSKCDGPGQLAAARFTFARGKIAVWEQVPVPKQSSNPTLPKA
jgi:ketosteroid isomerase-like protein